MNIDINIDCETKSVTLVPAPTANDITVLHPDGGRLFKTFTSIGVDSIVLPLYYWGCSRVIPIPVAQYRLAQSRIPIEMMCHG